MTITMKDICLISITILAFVAGATGWAKVEKYYDADHPGKCTYNDQLILSPGEIINNLEDWCTEIKCIDKEGFLSITGCGARATPPNCKSGGAIHKNAPYPKCCEIQWICNDVKADKSTVALLSIA